MPDEQTSRPELANLGRAPLAAAIVVMSALLAETIIATAVGVDVRAEMALLTFLTLASAALGITCLGRCALAPVPAALAGTAILTARAFIDPGIDAGIGLLGACVLTVFAASLLGTALGRLMNAVRRPWTIGLCGCALQILAYSIPSLGGAIRAGAFVRIGYSLPVPRESALSVGFSDGAVAVFGLCCLEVVFLGAFVWRTLGVRGGAGRTMAAVGASALAAALVTAGLGFRIPLLPFLVAGFYLFGGAGGEALAEEEVPREAIPEAVPPEPL